MAGRSPSINDREVGEGGAQHLLARIGHVGAEAEEQGISIDYDAAREIVYGMPYAEWKDKFQQEASPEQLEKFKQKNPQ